MAGAIAKVHTSKIVAAIICAMRTKDVIEYFGSQREAARKLGLSQPSISNWGEYPPDARQLHIEKVTRKKLKAEPGCLERLITPPAQQTA